MGGRDHAIQCEKCGVWYSGFNGPDECDCGLGPTVGQEMVVAGLHQPCEHQGCRWATECGLWNGTRVVRLCNDHRHEVDFGHTTSERDETETNAGAGS